MLIYILLMLIIPALCLILALRFQKKYNRLKSQESYESEAKKKADELTYTDPVITCDYCGNAINTGLYKRCPVCNGEYSHDEEWINRHRIDMSEFDRAASEHSSKQIERLDNASKGLLRLFKVFLIIGCSIFLFFGIIIIVFLIDTSTVHYQESQPVNLSATDNYVKENYSVTGNACFIDYEGITAEVSGIYRDSRHKTFKIEYTVSNNSQNDYYIDFELKGINNYLKMISTRRFNVENEIYVEPGKSIVFYDEVMNYFSSNDIEGISSLLIGNIEVGNSDKHFIFDLISTKVINTEYSGPVYSEWEEEGNCVFYTDENLTVSLSGADENNMIMYIKNTGSEAYEISSTRLLLNNQETYTQPVYSIELPVGAVYYCGYLYSSSSFKDMKPGDVVTVQFTLKFKDKPEKTYSTDYIRLK